MILGQWSHSVTDISKSEGRQHVTKEGTLNFRTKRRKNVCTVSKNEMLYYKMDIRVNVKYQVIGDD